MLGVGGDTTRRLLVDAGIAAGIRVLDVGCGHGDVALIAAALVGEGGRVLGVDRDAQPLATARERARGLGLSNTAFAQGDFDALPPEHEPFDAIVGRRVLMCQPDPAGAVGRVARALRPGGRVVFQEHDSAAVPAPGASLPPHERARGWMWRTVEREGADVHMGFSLRSTLARAGLAVEHVRAEATVLTPTMGHPVGAIVRAMLPRIVRHGVATEEEIDVDTLDRRLAEERAAADATHVWELAFGAWARKPG